MIYKLETLELQLKAAIPFIFTTAFCLISPLSRAKDADFTGFLDTIHIKYSDNLGQLSFDSGVYGPYGQEENYNFASSALALSGSSDVEIGGINSGRLVREDSVQAQFSFNIIFPHDTSFRISASPASFYASIVDADTNTLLTQSTFTFDDLYLANPALLYTVGVGDETLRHIKIHYDWQVNPGYVAVVSPDPNCKSFDCMPIEQIEVQPSVRVRFNTYSNAVPEPGSAAMLLSGLLVLGALLGRRPTQTTTASPPAARGSAPRRSRTRRAPST